MNKKIERWKSQLDSRKANKISDFLAVEGQEKEGPIFWEIRQTEYDSGPKMGID